MQRVPALLEDEADIEGRGVEDEPEQQGNGKEERELEGVDRGLWAAEESFLIEQPGVDPQKETGCGREIFEVETHGGQGDDQEVEEKELSVRRDVEIKKQRQDDDVEAGQDGEKILFIEVFGGDVHQGQIAQAVEQEAAPGPDRVLGLVDRKKDHIGQNDADGQPDLDEVLLDGGGVQHRRALWRRLELKKNLQIQVYRKPAGKV